MTDKPDLDHLRQWIGRTEAASDIVTAQTGQGPARNAVHGNRQAEAG